jgi:phosphohistidine phosphatase
MRILYLLRHAKSDRSDPALADSERPLAPRGRRDAPAMGAYMRHRKYRPALVLCSTSVRTRETLALLLPEFGERIAVEYDRKLYLASAEIMLQRLREVDEEVGSVLMIGHNPGMARLAALLAPRGDRHALARMREKYPTSGLAVVHLHVDRWEQADPGAGTLTDFMVPAELPKER